MGKKVPVISIGVGMAEMKKGKPTKTNKSKMMRGGMANPGLKALAKTRPDVVAKILK